MSAKVTDPVILENSQELQTPTFFKSDIEKISKEEAIKVLEEFGDDVINKAIEDGKIHIPGGGLEVIEWDGDRNFTQEEIAKLAELKACVKNSNGNIYYVVQIPTSGLWLLYIYSQDDGVGLSAFNALFIYPDDGSFDVYPNLFEELPVGTKLYLHTVLCNDLFQTLKIVTNFSNNLKTMLATEVTSNMKILSIDCDTFGPGTGYRGIGGGAITNGGSQISISLHGVLSKEGVVAYIQDGPVNFGSNSITSDTVTEL